MPLIISNLTLESEVLSSKSSSSIDMNVVDTEGGTAEGVVAIINNQIIPLKLRGDSHWYNQLHPALIGECSDEPIVIHAFSITGGHAYDDDTLTISVEGDAPDDPLQFLIDFITTEWNPSLCNGVSLPKLLKIWEFKRYNKCEFDYILFIEEEREVEQMARGRYKTVKFPVLIEIHSIDEERSKWILYHLQRILEQYHGSLDSPLYDYIELRNEGKNFSTYQNYKFAYSIALVKNYRYLEDIIS